MGQRRRTRSRQHRTRARPRRRRRRASRRRPGPEPPGLVPAHGTPGHRPSLTWACARTADRWPRADWC
nr:hypothetical protein [Arenimonas oryziterrae]